MKSKINIKLLFFLATIISLILTIISIRTTYARYVTSLTTKSYVELGKWLILVNNQDITNNSDVSSVVTPVFTTSDYIATGNLAPTSSGAVEITFNYEDVTVPFTYNLSFSHEADSALADLKLLSYSVNDGELVNVDDPTTIITDTIYPTDTTRTRTFKLNFTWFDGEGESSNDIQDTVYANTVDKIGLRFNMEFIQIVQPTT